MSLYLTLKKLGLSKTAIDCYESLFNEGSANAVQLATRLSRPRTGLYRVLKRLEEQGFVVSLKTTLQPTYFYAQPLEKALESLSKYQQQAVSELIKEQGNH